MVAAAAAAGPVPTQSNRETKLSVRIVVIKWWLRAACGGACTCRLSRLGGSEGTIPCIQEVKTSLGYIKKEAC